MSCDIVDGDVQNELMVCHVILMTFKDIADIQNWLMVCHVILMTYIMS